MRHIECDIAIIGAGTAGMTAYASAKRAGKRVLLIESGPYGTMCARVGCMPSKLLIAAAEAAHVIRSADVFGLPAPEALKIDGAAVMRRVKTERDRFVAAVQRDVAGFDEGDTLQGQARFIDDHRLQVGQDVQVSAKHIIVATGSEPVMPKELQALGARLISNEDVFDWDDLPQRLLLVGTGAIGLELGQALTRLGVKVSLVGRSPALGGIQHAELRESARDILSQELDLRQGVDIISAQVRDEQALVRLRHNGHELEESYDYVLAAAGRSPRLQGLGWENTSAQLDSHGMPDFDKDTLQIKGMPVFLAGDVNHAHPLQHEAADDGRFAVAQAVDGEQADPIVRRSAIGLVFSDPQIARVGQVFKEVPDDILCGVLDYARQGRARVIAKAQGKLHVYADRQGRFLGAEMFGPQVEHLAHLLAWAHQQGMTIQRMLEMPFYHPVLEEGLRTALRDVQRQMRALQQQT